MGGFNLGAGEKKGREAKKKKAKKPLVQRQLDRAARAKQALGKSAEEKSEPISGSRLMRPLELAKRLGVSPKTLARMRERHEIGPKRRKMGTRIVAWDRLEIELWIINPRPDGSFHTAKSWPKIWAKLKRSATQKLLKPDQSAQNPAKPNQE